MVTERGLDCCPASLHTSPKDLRMNAKARKKNKRKAERGALGTAGTTEHTAQDAELWGEPHAKEPDDSGYMEPASWTAAEMATCNRYVSLDKSKGLPEAFAAAVSQLLIRSGLHGVSSDIEFDMLKTILEYKVLPPIAQGLHDLRQIYKVGKRVEEVDVTVEMQWQVMTEGAPILGETMPDRAHTQPDETPRDEPAQGAVQHEQHPLDGHVRAETDIAMDSAAEVNHMWESASKQAVLDGGDKETVHQSTVRIYRALKKKQKAKEKKGLGMPS